MNKLLFVDRMIDAIKSKNNPTVVGLDPKLDFIPEHILNSNFDKYGKNLEGAAAAITEFNFKLIDEIKDIVPVVKPQIAYYEMYGIPGIQAYKNTLDYARKNGLLIIADGKRNDIGSTAEAYSKAHLGLTVIDDEVMEEAFGADALTVNPYLGIDGIKPFMDDCKKYHKGIFVLVKTSNKSSGQLQDLITVDERSIYEVVAQLVNEWGTTQIGENGYSSVGAVVGATYPNQAKVLRKIMKSAYILVPGYGAQGGTAMDAANNFNQDGLGAIVNASRSIMCAWQSEAYKDSFKQKEFAKAARAEAERMRDDLNSALK
jgi:orotidine-5'-phosphate decarboxylase